MHDSFYKSPFGYFGVGSDIKWCGRWSGSKFCLYCGHRAKFKEWSENWKWYYLLEWRNNNDAWWGYREYAHFDPGFYHAVYSRHPPWGITYVLKPKRYTTVGLKETDLKSLLKRGCKPKRKCKCVSVLQRGAWYCPECFQLITRMAGHKGVPFHDLTIINKNKFKEEILILLLSGTI